MLADALLSQGLITPPLIQKTGFGTFVFFGGAPTSYIPDVARFELIHHYSLLLPLWRLVRQCSFIVRKRHADPYPPYRAYMFVPETAGRTLEQINMVRTAHDGLSHSLTANSSLCRSSKTMPRKKTKRSRTKSSPFSSARPTRVTSTFSWTSGSIKFERPLSSTPVLLVLRHLPIVGHFPFCHAMRPNAEDPFPKSLYQPPPLLSLFVFSSVRQLRSWANQAASD